MASVARRHQVTTATGMGLLLAIAVAAALGAILVVLFAVTFSWLPGAVDSALPWAIDCLGVAGASVFLIWRFARRADHENTSM